MVDLLRNVSRMIELFDGVAGTDPLSAALLAIGGLLVGVSSAVLGYLALGAAVDAVMPDRIGRAPPQRD